MTVPDITASQLKRLASTSDPALVQSLVAPLNAQLGEAGIDTSLRVSHFLAQCCYESGYFTRLSEDLNYSSFRIGVIWPKLKERAASLANNPEALGNAAYAGQYGNGDETSGDGFRFHGRGLLQHTFRDNYAELSAHIGTDLVDGPDQLSQSEIAVKAAIYFFISRGCLPLADADDARDITRKINGGVEGLADRMILKHQALNIFGA